MYEVDARGLSCPEPVMMTAEAIKNHGDDTIKVLVSEPHCYKNVEKFAQSQGRKAEVHAVGSEFEVIITK